MYDAVIIGGGVVGAFTARALCRRKLKICVIEKNTDVATGASGANSGIVHGGFDAPTGSLKALYNRLGNPMLKKAAAELGVKCGENGSLVVASGEKEERILHELSERGRANGIEKLSFLSGDEARALEPSLNPKITLALRSETAGIVCPYELTIAAIGNAMDNGVELKTGCEVTDIKKIEGGYAVFDKSGGETRTKTVVNCAGIAADKIANMLGDCSFRIGARRGEYLLLDRSAFGLVYHTVFGVPDERGKGVLLTPTVDGNILIGPTSVNQDDRDDNSVKSDGIEYIKQTSRRLSEKIPFGATITSFAGIRAYSDRHDFIIERSAVEKGLINVAGIESPGLSASPAIGEKAAELTIEALGGAEINPDYNGTRKPDYFFKQLSRDEKNSLIAKDPAFGTVVCRCEEITLGEIRYALSRNPRPVTVDAIKRRTRAGMGRCQGGFCQPRVAEEIAAAFGIPLEKVTKCGVGSEIFFGDTK